MQTLSASKKFHPWHSVAKGVLLFRMTSRAVLESGSTYLTYVAPTTIRALNHVWNVLDSLGKLEEGYLLLVLLHRMSTAHANYLSSINGVAILVLCVHSPVTNCPSPSGEAMFGGNLSRIGTSS
jgi:hypothetical protein